MNKVMMLLISVLMCVNFAVQAEPQQDVREDLEIEVYRSPSCGCCSKWVKHLESNHFKVKDFVTNDVQSIKDKYGVTKKLASCHTALVNGYVIEGHVPAADIIKLINRKPAVTGLSVPGMPMGTPGMEMGGRKDAYDVIAFDKEKNNTVFSHYSGNKEMK